MSSRSRLLPLLVLPVLAASVAWFVLPAGAVRASLEPGGIGPAPDPEERPAIELSAVPRRETARSALVAAGDEVFPCLEEGHASVSGRVVDEDGAAVPGARVVLLAAPHAADALAVRGSTLADERGCFDVRSASPGDVWLAVTWPGLRPATRPLAIEEGFADLAQPLVLERGVAITGRVLSGTAPLARVELQAVGPRAARRARVDDQELAIVDGRLEWGALLATTGADGTWSFRGLAPGRWVVRPHAFRCPGAVFPPGALPAEAIDAPAEGVDLRIPAARLALEVLDNGEPLPWAEIEIEYDGSRSTRRADAHGRLEIDVSPGEGLVVVVHAPGRVPSRQVVSGPSRGERLEVQVSAGPPAPPTNTSPWPLTHGARSLAGK